MKKPEQLSNKDHIRYINEYAVSLWSRLNWEHGRWFDCLKESLRQHRLYLIQCVEEREKIEVEKNKRCDLCGVTLSQDDIFNYVSYCYECWKVKYIDSVSILPNSPKITYNRLIKPAPRGVCL